MTHQSGIFAVRAVFFDTNKLFFNTRDCLGSKYTGLAGHTVAAQVVNKTPYCSFPEFNTKVAGETLTQNAY